MAQSKSRNQEQDIFKLRQGPGQNQSQKKKLMIKCVCRNDVLPAEFKIEKQSVCHGCSEKTFEFGSAKISPNCNIKAEQDIGLTLA
jgi:hypothetical protein